MNKSTVDYKKLAPFSYRQIKNKYLLVNDWGNFVFLNSKEFDQTRRGEFKKGGELTDKLTQNNFIRAKLPALSIAHQYWHLKGSLFAGPTLHIIIPTLRCDHACVYCHASARKSNAQGYDMDKETAKKALDIIFVSPNQYLVIEFQGGEPLLNWPLVKYIIESANKKKKQTNKTVEFRLVTNGSLLDKEKLEYLLKKKVSLCLSFDGPEKLHNDQRKSPRNSYQQTVKTIKALKSKEKKQGKKSHLVSTTMTATRASLKQPRQIIDTHLELNLNSIHLRYLNPFGLSKIAWQKHGYTMDQFLQFYRQAMDYILELNLAGTFFKEVFSETFLKKILCGLDPGHMDWRSPCGAGIGQIAYNYNGDIYTCDEGRMVSMTGDESYRLGNVNDSSYRDLMTSPITKTLCTASCLESLPGCEHCLYKPYCGVCPIYNHHQNGNVFAQIYDQGRCRLALGVMDYLFEKLQNKKIEKVFRSWVE